MATIVPLISSGVTGPLGVRHLPRVSSETLSQRRGKWRTPSGPVTPELIRGTIVAISILSMVECDCCRRVVKSCGAGQREFDCFNRHGRINPPMHAHVEDRPADGAGAPAVSEFAVSGMNCNNCARHVTEAIQDVAGVAGAAVRLEEGRATVRWKPGAEPNVERV